MPNSNTTHEVLAAVFQVRTFPASIAAGDGDHCPQGREELAVLLWQRALNPQKGTWSLPGGTLRDDEDLTTSARRLLAEKVDLRKVAHLEQLSVFSDPQRVPGPRRIASTFLGLVPLSADPQLPPDTAWHPVSKLPEMSFDHGTVVRPRAQSTCRETLVHQHRIRAGPGRVRDVDTARNLLRCPRLPGRCHQLATRAGASRRSDSHRQHRTVRQVGWTSTRPVPFHRLHLAGHRRIRRTTARQADTDRTVRQQLRDFRAATTPRSRRRPDR